MTRRIPEIFFSVFVTKPSIKKNASNLEKKKWSKCVNNYVLHIYQTTHLWKISKHKYLSVHNIEVNILEESNKENINSNNDINNFTSKKLVDII